MILKRCDLIVNCFNKLCPEDFIGKPCEYEISTADIIAELENRRYDKCINCACNGNPKCSKCFWDSVFNLHSVKDYFKAK